jgi:hypothetical protein
MRKLFNVAFITLPNENILPECQDLHGYWETPECVLEFWRAACKIDYHGPEDYEIKKNVIQESYLETIRQFYRDNAL